MNVYANKLTTGRIKQNANTTTIKEKISPANTFQFQDNRPAALLQKKQLEIMASSDSATVPVQRKTNHTGLPDNLKSGIESLSGFSMDDVKVHYNSAKPAQMQAYAYAQGTDIHLGAGQEKHLPHEAWHVVQQKQGRVRPTRQLKGKVYINDDAGLEKEADVMGAKALATDKSNNNKALIYESGTSSLQTTIQNKPMFMMPKKWHEYDAATIKPGDGATRGDADHDIVSYLQFLLKNGFDPDTAEDYTKGELENLKGAISRLKGIVPSIRSAVGLGNPSHKQMAPLFEKAAMSPVDTSRKKEEWLFSPSRRFETASPTSRTVDSVPTKGHENTVMGHDEGASNYWNREGHKLPPADLRKYNKELTSYHGLEQRAKSDQSGGGTPKFKHPSRKLGSWEGYWNSNHPDFKAVYHNLWPETIE